MVGPKTSGLSHHKTIFDKVIHTLPELAKIAGVSHKRISGPQNSSSAEPFFLAWMILWTAGAYTSIEGFRSRASIVRCTCGLRLGPRDRQPGSSPSLFCIPHSASVGRALDGSFREPSFFLRPPCSPPLASPTVRFCSLTSSPRRRSIDKIVEGRSTDGGFAGRGGFQVLRLRRTKSGRSDLRSPGVNAGGPAPPASDGPGCRTWRCRPSL